LPARKEVDGCVLVVTQEEKCLVTRGEMCICMLNQGAVGQLSGTGDEAETREWTPATVVDARVGMSTGWRSRFCVLKSGERTAMLRRYVHVAGVLFCVVGGEKGVL
jgi:hypothetical protein